MTSTFTPSQAVDMSKEKDWPVNLGMLDWDTTSIVFTKRSLVEFLKYTGTTVDPGFGNIQKLPRYAKFGKLTSTGEEPAATITSPTVPLTGNGRLLAEEFTDDALSTAPPPPEDTQSELDAADRFIPTRRVRTRPGGHDSISTLFVDNSKDEEFVPTRRVRQRPGGDDNIEGLF
ncbi:hypothetical protein K503DRAFT_775391 [Rhizopogon vinicolor AM-OR11-026]|uniref:Uncharacterized protein n=1 Tax=Rhizopogon vinicolor AM-OR11-026 TaxID=1314800 RepID=A0A1B7MM04_9AGAM|nr:hypothetical protein K503DRAFT_775391 [Rhizopogon vinicolor AM-OR11-026]